MVWIRTRLEVPAIAGDPSVLLAAPNGEAGDRRSGLGTVKGKLLDAPTMSGKRRVHPLARPRDRGSGWCDEDSTQFRRTIQRPATGPSIIAVVTLACLAELLRPV